MSQQSQDYSNLAVALKSASALMNLHPQLSFHQEIMTVCNHLVNPNFLNLLDISEQKQVQNRLLFVAESFRANLPPGFSNLYRVDALPALRARLKGDVAEVKKAYKTLVKKCHPDLFVHQPKLQKQAEDKMRLLNQAYGILEKYYG